MNFWVKLFSSLVLMLAPLFVAHGHHAERMQEVCHESNHSVLLEKKSSQKQTQAPKLNFDNLPLFISLFVFWKPTFSALIPKYFPKIYYHTPLHYTQTIRLLI